MTALCETCGAAIVRKIPHALRFCSPQCFRDSRRPTPERFWAKVAIGGPDDCWPWTGRDVNPSGHGRTRWNGRNGQAHRIAYELTHGSVPDGLQVLHHCDNPPCCNPRHLYAGTHADNMRDKKERGRVSRVVAHRGEDTPGVRLTERDVREIRALHPRWTQAELGARYGVSPWTIRRVVYRETWKHVA